MSGDERSRGGLLNLPLSFHKRCFPTTTISYLPSARSVLLLSNLGWALEEVSAGDDVHHWAVLRIADLPDTRPFDQFVDV